MDRRMKKVGFITLEMVIPLEYLGITSKKLEVDLVILELRCLMFIKLVRGLKI